MRFMMWAGSIAGICSFQLMGKLVDSEACHREVARIISESHLWDGPRQ